MYAVVRTGGKQYRVEEGRPVTIERVPGEVGDVVELGDVLLMDGGTGATIGTPTVDGARVLGTIAEQGRAKKIVVFRYKAKTRYRKKTGHRQAFTRLMIDDILLPGQEPKAKEAAAPPPADEAPTKGRRRKSEAPVATATEPAEPADAALEAEQAANVEAEEATTPAADAPKRGRKKAD